MIAILGHHHHVVATATDRDDVIRVLGDMYPGRTVYVDPKCRLAAVSAGDQRFVFKLSKRTQRKGNGK